MKLAEIKNSLAKLYYEISDFKLTLSDFLTIDDGNQKILAQVVSIESTNKDSTNCAVLKFSLDLNDDGTHSAYSGYVPTLDALVSLTPKSVLKKVFCKDTGISLGVLTNSSSLPIVTNSELFDNFLYIQTDKHESKQDIIAKILNFNSETDKKTLFIDFENITEFDEYPTIRLGKEFKLPIASEILNYIYENDLTGLTVEQQAIVQDIILEIQEYIDTLEDGYIPFDTLLNVVNEIYESDKSAGIILFRNKLLKYSQSGIFASCEDEICAVEKTLEENTVIVLKLDSAEQNWQKETLDFLVNFIQNKFYLVLEALDDVVSKDTLINIYKNKNIKPVIVSSYELNCAGHLKSFAKNLILYKPENQQRTFATYNSFLNKLSGKEFILSGENTFYTPLIIKELPNRIEQIEQLIQNTEEDISQQIQEIQQDTPQDEVVLEPLDEDLVEDIKQNIDLSVEDGFDTQDEFFEENDLDTVLDYADDQDQENQQAESTEYTEILEETIEEQIAKDVDGMFFVETPTVNEEQINNQESEKMVNIEVDLINTIDANDDLLEDTLFAEPQQEQNSFENDDDSLLEDDLELLDILSDNKEIVQPDILQTQNSFIEEQDNIDEPYQIEEPSIQQTQNIPIYQTEFDEPSNDNSDVEIAVGNIVYHEKYGRGVVEQFINYGNKSFCSILFDNVGIKLMDPKLAGLKQM